MSKMSELDAAINEALDKFASELFKYFEATFGNLDEATLLNLLDHTNVEDELRDRMPKLLNHTDES